MQKFTKIALALLLSLALLVGCVTTNNGEEKLEDPIKEEVPKTVFKIGSLKGPTTMGMVKLMEDGEAGKTKHDYQVNMYGTADEIVPQLVKGDLDLALVPCNLASVLYNRTEGEVQVAAINTLGVLYIVESGDTIQSIADLAGKTIYSTGKGTTPEFALNYLLKQNGLVPDKDVKVEFKSEATELAVMLAEAENAIAVLPQPYVSVVQMQNAEVRVALNMTEEWDKVSTDSSMVTGVLLVRKDFARDNQGALADFLEEYKVSTEYINKNVAEGAILVEKYGIVPNAKIAERAIPACNIVYIDGEEMEQKIKGYLEVLYDANPQSVGGALPEDDFYYKK